MQTIGMISSIAKFRFMHIGLVRVAVKPLLRTGVNAPIYLTLCDKRLRHYKSSLLAVIQSNVCKGPIFFNCYPNFMVDLTCPMTTEALSLTFIYKVMSFLISKILLLYIVFILD